MPTGSSPAPMDGPLDDDDIQLLDFDDGPSTYDQGGPFENVSSSMTFLELYLFGMHRRLEHLHCS